MMYFVLLMRRRNFLKNASLAGLSIPATHIPFDKVKPGSSEFSSFELDELTISGLQAKMQSGELTSESITRKYLQRIAQFNNEGPKLNAIIELNPDAPAIAKSLDLERKSGKVRGPMHGIPVVVKDNIETGDKMMTTAGSIALVGNVASRDAFIINKLRESGAVILGKANLSEWSNFRSSDSQSGWSSRGGQTKNPCVLDRNPSGSSSGSAAAVAANLCAVAIGTETDGSIISPASHTGIVGIKPTTGLLSRSGIIPISKTQDTAGPLARTVTDAAILLAALTGIDEKDDLSRASIGRAEKDFTRFITKNALKGKRIGVDKMFLKGNQHVVSLYVKAIDLIKSQGATVIEIDFMNSYYQLEYSGYTLMLYEFKQGIRDYLATTNSPYRTLEDLIKFNNDNAAKAMPYFGQEIFEASLKKGDLTSKEYTAMLKRQPEVRNLIDDTLSKFRLNAICGTSSGIPGAIDVLNGDYNTGFYFGSPAATSGYPHITVPMGKIYNLPVGLSFMSTAFNEAELIGLAYAYEQASKKRESPKFIPTIIPS